MSLVEQDLPTLPEHPSSHPVFSQVRVTLHIALFVCFVDRCLSFCGFYFDHCVVCSSIYGFWLPLWYLQTLLKWMKKINFVTITFFFMVDRFTASDYKPIFTDYSTLYLGHHYTLLDTGILCGLSLSWTISTSIIIYSDSCLGSQRLINW